MVPPGGFPAREKALQGGSQVNLLSCELKEKKSQRKTRGTVPLSVRRMKSFMSGSLELCLVLVMGVNSRNQEILGTHMGVNSRNQEILCTGTHGGQV